MIDSNELPFRANNHPDYDGQIFLRKKEISIAEDGPEPLVEVYVDLCQGMLLPSENGPPLRWMLRAARIQLPVDSMWILGSRDAQPPLLKVYVDGKQK